MTIEDRRPGATPTAEQAAIVAAAPTSRLLVTAGPGTGKTFTLIARLNELIERHDISPGTELLVLSFSRAAVYEVRRRVAAAGGDVRYVRASTFDSFATALLTEHQPETDLSKLDYDARIRRATVLLQTSDEARDALREYRHVLVDEVQDLVGVRAAFVLAILHTIECGFTVLGDPAQGIYGFQLTDPERKTGAAAFYADVRRSFGPTLEERHLTVNRRVEAAGAGVALWAGAHLNAAEPDFAAIKDGLESIVVGLPTLGSLDLACRVLRKPGATTAVLCRTNGDALLVSRALHASTVPHIIQRRATDRVVPAWVAVALRDLEYRRVSRSELLDRLEGSEPASTIDPPTAYRLLKRMDGAAGDAVDVGRISESLRIGTVPDDLLDRPTADLIVSTIHRAKGLEFDRVVLAIRRDAWIQDELAEETRILYVALTRAKRTLWQLELPRADRPFLISAIDRWVVRARPWETKAFDVRGDDTHSADPAGGFLLDDIDAVDTQRYLSEAVRRGDPIVLDLLFAATDGTPRVHYAVIHQGRAVGVTSEAFGRDLFAVLQTKRGRPVPWPTRIDGLFVEGVDSVAGTDAAGRRCGLGSAGIWLRIRVAGLSRLCFD